MKNDINALYNELKTGITGDRLKEISIDVISRYRAKNISALMGYARLLKIDGSAVSINRLFAGIIQHYHPDKLSKIHNEIEKKFSSNDIDELVRIREMFLFRQVPKVFVNDHVKDLYEPDYETGEDEEYGYSDDDFGYDETETYSEDDMEYEEDTGEMPEDEEDSIPGEYGFMEALHSSLFGNLDVTLTPADLMNMDGEIDLSDMDITGLDGVEYCVYVQSLNLSGNNLYKIDHLGLLTNIEFLFISENHIENIDCLENLGRLKELDISFNEIDDITVLLKLESLVYVNVMGNPLADTDVVKQLSDRGVIVIS